MQDIALAPTTSPASRSAIRQASFLDTFAVLGDVVLPTIAKGVILRRRSVLALAQALDLDRRAIRRMQRIRDSYGTDPLLLRVPGRSIALILDPRHVHRVLHESPEPFATATEDKTASLTHFEPKGVLISQGAERTDRRRYNEQVLDAHQPVHRLAERFLEVIAAEASTLCRDLLNRGADLTWEAFADAWFRSVRRIVFGDAASNDNELSEIMAKLRSAANWAFLTPRRDGLRTQLLGRIEMYLAQADPQSLAGVMAHTPANALTAPAQQVPQWLFAFDAAGMTAFRTLALLASHREYARNVRAEIGGRHAAAKPVLPYTRAAALEALRLWPTTPLLLRQSTTETTWADGCVMPKGAELLIFTPFFHRDGERLPYADRFAPEVWSAPCQQDKAPLIPFSEGPAICPGRHLVLLLAPAMIAGILDNARVRLRSGQLLDPDHPLPATLNHFGLRFELRR